MLGSILFIVFVLFSLFEFSEGVRIGIEKPLFLLTGILSLVVSYLLIKLVGTKFVSGISIKKNSLIDRIRKNRIYRVLAVTLIWILAIGNFTYANHWIGTSISSGAEYIDAFVLTIISYVILDKKIKIV